LITAWGKNYWRYCVAMPSMRKPCDVHTNCLNEGCHLLLSNVSNVLSRWKVAVQKTVLM
jgi:hypothetical protein